MNKESDLEDLSQNKPQKVLMKIDETADAFINSTN